ncbi:glycosyltransferase [Caenimonas aquaedulcis]|uniref:Glycosyltransferase n=1 Tax=Caenimonas aquaedulcis TaxID=2793270 RepID=A0A931MGN8_9BURK|nr:glycosyltransferase [Caenimonas aquaedulcis]MBG9388188.1 glycosyltransferase [Caenimonas aquaedulcis]
MTKRNISARPRPLPDATTQRTVIDKATEKGLSDIQKPVDAPATRIASTTPRAVYFSFMHPDLVPGGAQTIAKNLHEAHLRRHGPGTSLFIGAMVGGGPRRPAGSDIVQMAPQEFVYIAPNFDFEYFTNHDELGQVALLELVQSFGPTVLHFHHFMGFGIDFVQACLARFDATSVFTIHEHMLVCHNDGHLLQNNNNHICTEISYARCSTCLPQFRYDYFQHRMAHFARVIEKFDHVTAVSAFTAGLVGTALGLSKPVTVVPNGPIFRDRAVIDDDLSILRIAFIGQIHRTKGVHLLLESVLALCKMSSSVARRFDIGIWGNFVGDDAYRARIEQAVAELAALRVPVALHGAYDASDLPALLSDRNVVVIPSLWPESYCLTADEALQLGKILVCSEFPAIRERFAASDSTLYFPMGSAGGLRMRLQELLARPPAPRSQVAAAQSFTSFEDIYNRYSAMNEVAHAAH